MFRMNKLLYNLIVRLLVSVSVSLSCSFYANVDVIVDFYKMMGVLLMAVFLSGGLREGSRHKTKGNREL